MRMSAYLGLQWQMRYHEAGSMNNEYVHILIRMSRNRINQTCMANKPTKRSISHEIIYVGPPPKPVYFAWINLINLIIWELRRLISCLFKTFWNSEELWKLLARRKNGSEFYLKSGFLRPKTLRMKFRRRELKSFEKYLKTGIYGVVLK